MATAESSPGEGARPGAGAKDAAAAARAGEANRAARRWAWPGLAAVLLVGLGLRLWGVAAGLPYVYNSDEGDHFVPRAVRMFEHGLNPHYFANPPAFTYLLHYVFAIAYGGAAGAVHALDVHPQEVYTLARVLSALLGTLALWLLYAAGSRLFGRAVGLLAAAIQAVAFLPVFYAHLALNDVPTLAPLTLSLLGSAGVLRKGRARDYLLAGLGLGLACATKYTAGIVLLPLVAAIAARYLERDRAAGRRALLGIALAGAAALLAFLIANPYSLLDYGAFHGELVHQSTLSAESQGKLGAPRNGGLSYYLWSFTWGLGWAPALAALGGAITICFSDRRLAWMLVPAPLLFLAFMGLQGRYFGRWILPIFPIVCLLAAFFVLQAVSWAKRPLEPSRGRPLVLGALLVTGLLVQGLVYSVHSGLVLSRTDTRTLTRRWMLAHIPAGTPIVVEPVSPNEWARERKPGLATAREPFRWKKYASLFSRLAPDGTIEARAGREVGLENYVRTLAPALIGYYESHGYCWVIRGSTQSARALSDPRAVPRAAAYYRELERHAEVVFRASPYRHDSRRVPFNFDWSFDYYPLAYERPGPQMTIYRLHGGGCRAPAAPAGGTAAGPAR